MTSPATQRVRRPPEVRPLVDLEPDAVAERVEEAVAQHLAGRLRELRRLPGRDERLAGRAEDRAGVRPRTHQRVHRLERVAADAPEGGELGVAARRRRPRTSASCPPSSARPGPAARCRRPPARPRRSGPEPELCPSARRAPPATITSRARSAPCSPATAAIASRTASDGEPRPQLADQRRGDGHRGVRRLLRAPHALDLRRRLRAAARDERVGRDDQRRPRRAAAGRRGRAGTPPGRAPR